jgi:hypothetical protein
MLHARGIGCDIYEASPKIRELGVGINVLPHGTARTGHGSTGTRRLFLCPQACRGPRIL